MTDMKKLEIADADVMRIAIQQEIQRSDEARYDHRLHGLLLVTGGQSCRQVAQLFDEDPRTVQRWVRTFEERGFDGLRDGQRTGRPRTLSAEQWGSLKRDLRFAPDRFGSGRPPVGRQAPQRAPAAPLRRGLGRASVPTLVPADGLPVPQAPSANRQGGPATGGGF